MLGCFSAAWLVSFLVWLVVVIALISIVNIVVPWLLAKIGGPPDGGIVLQVLRIIVWAIVAIFIIYFIADLLACALGGGGLAFPRR